jgi:hypothetical protein
MNRSFFYQKALTSSDAAAGGGRMSSNCMMALLYLGGSFALGGAREVEATTVVKIAKGGGATLWVSIGCKEVAAVFSCEEVASASLVGLFPFDNFVPSRNVFLILQLSAPEDLNRLPTPLRGRGIVQSVIIF